MKTIQSYLRKSSSTPALALITFGALICCCLQGSLARAQAPSTISGISLTLTISGATRFWAPKGTFTFVFSTNDNSFIVVGNGTTIDGGNGIYSDYHKVGTNGAQLNFNYVMQNGSNSAQQAMYLGFSSYAGGSFYLGELRLPYHYMMGTFTCSGDRISSYEAYLYEVSQALTQYSANIYKDGYLANALYHDHIAAASFHYMWWDTGDGTNATRVASYYTNLAKAWWDKYANNYYYTTYAGKAWTYLQEMAATNLRQAYSVYFYYLSKAYYHYWLREGDSAKANSFSTYYATLSNYYAH